MMTWCVRGRVEEMREGEVQERDRKNESRKGESCWIRWVPVNDFIGGATAGGVRMPVQGCASDANGGVGLTV